MKYRIPFIRPEFPSSEEMIEDYRAILDSNWYTNFGPYELDLSQKVAEYVGQDIYATTVANCTLGLDLAIIALFDKSNGNKVLVPSFTFAAGPEMLIRNDFEPVLLDVEADTWHMSIKQAEEILSNDKEIAGILLCNSFGVGNPKIEQWELLAKKYNKKLIIDSAAGFGSRYTSDEIIGGRGDCEVFSLHATKPFAVGEGGLVTSRDQTLIKKIRVLQNFGFEGDRTVHTIGTNAKMQEFNCAIGIRQLSKLQTRISGRQQKLATYKAHLKDFEFQPNDTLSTVPFVSVLVPEGYDADFSQQSLLDASIEARRYYTPALHLHSAIKERSSIPGPLTVTESMSDRIISLPLLNDMTDEDIIGVCETLIKTRKA
ncbi:MAG: aminotransferase class I/II-fold pyridoxal phosphate-dependent enzyme [Candidatus Saccharimonadales bacterium]